MLDGSFWLFEAVPGFSLNAKLPPVVDIVPPVSFSLLFLVFPVVEARSQLFALWICFIVGFRFEQLAFCGLH